VEGVGSVLHEDAANKRASSETEERAGATNQAPEAWIGRRRQVEEPRADGAGGDPDADAGEDSPDEEGRDVLRNDEDQHGRDFDHETASEDDAPPQMVRKPARRQQGAKTTQGVRGVDRRQGDGRKVPQALIDTIEWRRRTGGGQEQDEKQPEKPEGDAAVKSRRSCHTPARTTPGVVG
jgi:hypothetical protein